MKNSIFSLNDSISNLLQQKPNHNLVKDLGDERWLTRGEVDQLVEQLTILMAQSGVKQGDLILITLPNSVDYVITLLACFRLKAIAYTANPTMPTSELTKTIQKNHYAAAFFGNEHAGNLPRIEAETGTFFSDNPCILAPHKTMSFYRLSGQKHLANDQLDTFNERTDGQLASLLYTSGTTGAPKAVALTAPQLLSAAKDVALSQHLSDEDRTLVMLPLFHINAQVISLLATIISGGQLVITHKFSAHKFWQTINDEQITWVSAAPAIIAILLRSPQPETIFNKLRFIRCASAPLPPSQEQLFEHLFSVPVIQGYGMTEAASQITVNPLSAPRQGSVGQVTNSEMKIVDDRHQPVSANQIGQVTLRGSHIIHQYVDPQYQAEFINGWFLTGDMGYVDTDGYLFLVGRKREIINRSGDKISPLEVEDAILSLGYIRDVAVVGQPDAIYGEQVVAVVVLQPNLVAGEVLAKDIQQHVQQQLSRFKVPSEIIFWRDLPTGATGKIQRTKVKALLGG